MFLKGKCALVTGSTSGIGLAYARALAETPIRKCLEARARAAARRAQAQGEPIQQALL